jgi:hypothetical protein
MARLVLCLLILGASRTSAWADGFVFAAKGRIIPEREQHALLEWRDGKQTLYLSTKTDEVKESHVWIVPIPGAPDAVAVEPVLDFPVVSKLRDVLDSGEKPPSATRAHGHGPGHLPMACGGSHKDKGVAVHQHIESSAWSWKSCPRRLHPPWSVTLPTRSSTSPPPPHG